MFYLLLYVLGSNNGIFAFGLFKIELLLLSPPLFCSLDQLFEDFQFSKSEDGVFYFSQILGCIKEDARTVKALIQFFNKLGHILQKEVVNICRTTYQSFLLPSVWGLDQVVESLSMIEEFLSLGFNRHLIFQPSSKLRNLSI